MSKKDADAYAKKQYEAFAARRRALLEAEGERDPLRILEETAKRLPKMASKNPRTPRKKASRGKQVE